MGLFDKFKSKLDGSNADGPRPTQQGAGGGGIPTIPLGPDSVIRYRQQRGVNLGSWFSQEAWICDGPFADAKGSKQSDLDIAKSGPKGKAALERHWDQWITDDDWQWIVDRGFNTVRLPIGYYHLAHPSACPAALKGTDFESYSQVYVEAWPRIQRALEKAQQYGLGVLVDLHGCSGNQNNDAHSGTSSGKTGMWNSKKNLNSTREALLFLVTYLAPLPHCVGLELMNEPANNDKLGGWYESTIQQLRAICGPDFPLYISDAWDTQWYAAYPSQKYPREFLVVDHHLYRCFTEQDRNLSGDQHAQALLHGPFRQEFASWAGEKARRNLIIGEFSAALDNHSYPAGCDDREKDRQRRVFLRAQLDLFEQYCAGWFFWTLKKGNGWDAGWSARDAATAEILPHWVGGPVRRPESQGGGGGDSGKHDHVQQAAHAHASYWSSQPNGPSPHPDIFAHGFSTGWDDARLFITHSASRSQRGTSTLGFREPWLRRRMDEFVGQGGPGNCVWEYEHGWRQGLEAAHRSLLQ